MRLSHHLLLALSLGAIPLVACRAQEPGLEPHERVHSFVFLTTAEPQPTLSPDEQRAAFEGHFSNMAAMAEAGDLHFAGPFGEVKSDPRWRGVFILDGDVDRGAELASTDPAVQAGVFDPKVHRFISATDFERYAELLREREAERASNPDTDPNDMDVRPYVLALGEPWNAARLGVLDGPLDAHVLVAGVLEMDGRERLALVLDHEEPQVAATALAASGDSEVTWDVSQLWSAHALAGLERGIAGR